MGVVYLWISCVLAGTNHPSIRIVARLILPGTVTAHRKKTSVQFLMAVVIGVTALLGHLGENQILQSPLPVILVAFRLSLRQRRWPVLRPGRHLP